ncbi:ABC transporter permease (plasmid) [Embleya sp. NBC_00888]|uniref:ABC transporter permease n=1 Tax=Embleya sp. NBC_00888 TaxID=2975960 RepID=UPI002F9194A0|nr:ABC transporter permease [Embleya sp. NBC_00888]
MLTWRWFAARMSGAVITLLGVTIVVFVVLRTIPGDAVTASLGTESGTLTPAQRASLNHYYGIDKSWFEQLWTWISGALHGDLGISLTSGKSVTDLLGTALPVTVEVAALAALMGTAAGVLLGVLAGARAGKTADTATQGVALFGLAVPEFVVGTAVVTILAEAFDYFPNTGTFVSLTSSLSENMSQVLYPSLVLAIPFAANVMRTTRSEYVEMAEADYVRTARGKGLHPGRIRRAHILRNATIPIVTLTGIQFGYLLGGTVIVEQIFALPGMGRLLLTSITNRDYPVVQGTVLVIAVLFVLVNLLVDLLYRAIDPRTRAV